MKYKLLLTSSLVAIVAMGLLVGNINAREEERVELNKVDGIPENPTVNSEWARYYPRQYSSWKKTKESDNIEDLVEKKPQLAVIWAGYRFAIDYNAPRGHYYAVQDNINSLRTGGPTDDKTGPMPTACWTCKSPDVVRLIEEDGELEFFTGKWARYGSEVVNAIGCMDCHDPKTAELAVGRPHLNKGLKAAGLPTFEESTHQEKRSLVCAQCHSEYYFKKTPYVNKEGKEATAAVVTFPWSNGLSAEDMEKYYDSIEFSDWTHKLSKTPMLKAQHPGYEISSTGIHAQKGVSCADCHMPYTQEGSVKYSDHQVRNPLETMDRSCMTCHRESEEKLKSIVARKFERKEFLMEIAMDNLAKAHLETARAIELGATDEELKEIRTLIRHGQWRWDYSIASHGSFFHAPEETLRLLASANEKAQQARIKLVKVLAKYGNAQYIAPDFDTKQKAQALAGVNMQAEIDAKMKFKKSLEQEWHKVAKSKQLLDEENRKDVDTKSSYFGN